jgi:imidazolonepropionase-like amidohydrolase
MEDMVAAGMTTAEVLAAATADAAKFLGLKDVGTIEVGNVADMLVLDADPLKSITNTRRISDVYVRGLKIDRSVYP